MVKLKINDQLYYTNQITILDLIEIIAQSIELRYSPDSKRHRQTTAKHLVI